MNQTDFESIKADIIELRSIAKEKAGEPTSGWDEKDWRGYYWNQGKKDAFDIAIIIMREYLE